MPEGPSLRDTVRTARLLLRPPQPSDIPALFEIQGDAAAMKFTTWAPDLAATTAFVDSYAARGREDRFAPWTALLGERIAGWGGLCRDPMDPHWGVEVIYFVHPDLWGQGIAGEIVHAALALAFDGLALPHVGAFARPANLASIRVLERAAFSRVRYVAELERDEFRIDASRWKLQSATQEKQ